MEGEPQGLCVSRGNVYVTCSGSRLIKVFTEDGLTCVRSFKLRQDMSNPWHAIPLSDSDRFLISHGLEGGRLHRLCIVDNNGKVRALPVLSVFFRAISYISTAYDVVRWLGVCLSVTFVYCVETAKDTAIVAMECE